MKSTTKETLILITGAVLITAFGFIYHEAKNLIETKPNIELINNIQKNKESINQLEIIKQNLNNNKKEII